jgi:3-oxoacyl-[acyl-carrier-protein] synthase-3
VAIFTIQGVKISGMAACAPKQKVSNMDYEWIPEKERKMFVKTVGIEFRHIGPDEHTTSDWCTVAADRLLNDLGWQRDEIPLLLFVSQSPDYYLPATSLLVQHRLGLSMNCMAFDINLGCSGFVYGLSVATSMMRSTGFKKALLLAGDKSSASTNYKDKSTYPLFGDAGIATALELDDTAEPMLFNLQSDGSRAEAIMIPDCATRNPMSPETYLEQQYEGGLIRHRRNLALDGLSVFNFSINEVPENIKATAEAAGNPLEFYDYLVLHQANRLMTEQIRRKLKFPPEKVPYSIQEFGNTSSASVPLTICWDTNEAVRTSKKWFLMSGFGVGLSWATASICLDHIVCPEVMYL